jgi:PAS domain S-box-containing protein
MATAPLPDQPPVRILHLEDSALDAELVQAFLLGDGLDCDVVRVWAREEFERALTLDRFDLILADHQLPGFDGEAALDIARVRAPETPFIFVSGTLGEEVAVEALKRGATDYVVKQRLERLGGVARRALAEVAERRERQQAQQALQAAEENFATLVNAMPLLCWMADANGRVNWFNARWYEYTGTTAADMQNDGWRGLHHPQTLPEFILQWRRSVETGTPFEMTFPLRGADGTYRPFLTRAHPVRDGAGRVVRWLGTSTDVSAQHAAEDALRRLNEELENRIVAAIAERERFFAQLGEMQKLETIGQLTGGVAHDFNNLLTPIIGNLDLLTRRIGEDARSRKLLDGAIQAADRAKILVQRLLAFARRQVLETRAVDTRKLIGNSAELIGRSIGPRITLEIDIAPDLPPARVDENQLELALLNLAVNARDAMPDGGRLTIRADAQSVGPDHPAGLRHGDYVRLSVIDTGAGMDASTLARAIEPFFSTKGIGKGTGLGLSMVHGLAAQSGGALLLDSTPGQGTTAEIWLPATSAVELGTVAADRTPMPDMPPSKILLVDDEDLARAGTAEMLAELGHDVVEAASGAEALQLLRAGLEPRLVITDFLMPGMTGADLATEIRNREDPPPVLLATGYAQLAGHQLADLPLLAKPFRQRELAERIAPLLAEAAG